MAIAVDQFTPSHVLDYWFTPPMSEHWFGSTPEIDAELNERFGELWLAAASNAYDHWQEEPDGALALVIVLDQIPLNIFRGQARSFSTEAKAREISRYAIDNGLDQKIDSHRRPFLYLPFLHSESLDDQDESVRLMENDPTMAEMKKWAHHHRDIVRRFGRFPHRNEILERPSTPEEIDWLSSEGSFSG